nr:MAG TPA: hypothetical protein [Caudoviricetes sp.]
MAGLLPARWSKYCILTAWAQGLSYVGYVEQDRRLTHAAMGVLCSQAVVEARRNSQAGAQRNRHLSSYRNVQHIIQ